MSLLVDFHCHLDLFKDFESIVQQCEQSRIYTLAVTTTPRAWERNKAITKNTKYVRAALGFHPQLVAQFKHELPLFFELIDETRYIGEIGIDGSKEYRNSIVDQTEVFNAILKRCAKSENKILSIHSRGAENEVFKALKNNVGAGKPILHWFTGSVKQLDEAIELGCWFSVGPAMLATQKGKMLVERMPLNKLLTETDAPFAKYDAVGLTPLNAPIAISLLADIWNKDSDASKQRVFSNLQTLLS